MSDDLLDDAPPARLDVPVCRAIAAGPEFRDSEPDDTSPGTLVGEFSVFDEWYEIRSWWEGEFMERIAPGAFKRTINNRSGETPVRVLLEHGYDPTVGDKPLGVPDTLEERDKGPYAETPLFDTSYNRDLAPALRGGAYGQSFRFQVLRDEWVEEPEVSDHNPRGIPERTITEVRLIEFGPTVFPASPATNDTTGLRSTTDSFYERLHRRDASRYDDALQSVRSTRAPEKAKPAKPGEARNTSDTPADPQRGHSEDPAPAKRGDHSTDSPSTHSDDTSTPTPPATSADQHRKSTSMDEDQKMTVEERTARQSEIRARLSELDTEFAGSVMPQEQRSEFDELCEEFDRHDAAIEEQERRRALIAERAGNDGQAEPGSSQRTNPKAPGVSRSGGRSGGSSSRPENIYDLNAVRQQARSMDEMSSLMRDNARRAIEVATFPGAPDPARAAEHVERLLSSVDDDSGTLARRILTTGSPTYERAFGKALRAGGTGALTGEEQRALSLGVDAEGGFAVPFQLDPTVMLTSDGVTDPLREIARVEQIVGKEWQGLSTEGVTASRKAEKAESDDNSPSFDQPTVKVSRVDAFVPFTVELDQDWNGMRGELTTLLADAKQTEEADSFINGDGSGNAAGVEPGGILATLDAGSNVITVAANAFTSDDLYETEEALGPRFRRNARWLADRSFYNAARQLGSDSDGGDLWVRLGQGLPSELIGYPTAENSEMPSFSLADNAKLAIFGDFKRFIIVDRVGMNIELVPHLFGANRRPTGMRGIWAFWRNGSKVLVDNAFRVIVVNPGV
jgi:HK97 family phage major capsid protein/HK97 family phage prohead protease